MKTSPKTIPDDSMISIGTILGSINRELDVKTNEFSTVLSVSSGARRVLACLASGDNLTQLALVRATKLKAPTISLIVQKMERDGLINRFTDDIDMRLTRVSMTEKGAELQKKLAAFNDDMDSAILNGFSDEEKKTLSALLTRVYANIETGRD
ncbi:MAG: MarR family transcriptional regulator [Clostridia bacterium]|nr:MarR family transcriptional regulator [Clostridia bacterium]